MRKIWVSGALGMLGSHFKRLLDRLQIPYIANDMQEMDITDLEKVSDFVRVQKISHIINCAAYTQVDNAEMDQKQAYLVNAVGPHHIGIAARRHRARVIHFSTDYVFDGKSRTPYTEEHYCTPIGAYGMSKLAGEIKLLDEHEDVCIIRTSWLFGFPGKNFVETMLLHMCEKEHIQVVDDQLGRPTYCQDLAEIAFELLDEEGVFHFANAFETSWFRFAEEIHRQALALNFPLKVKTLQPIASREYSTQAKRPSYSTLSTKKLEEFTGKAPRPWHDALYDYLVAVKNYREYSSLCLSHA